MHERNIVLNQDELIKQRLAPLAQIIPPYLPQASYMAVNALDVLGANRRECKKLYAELFNYRLRSFIRDTKDTERWVLTGGPDCIHLYDNDTHLNARVLKRFAFAGTVPPAGCTRTRATAWNQGMLGPFDEKISGLHPLEDVTMIIVWTEVGGHFECVAYRPIGTGKFPKGAPTSLAVPMLASVEEYDGIKVDRIEPPQRFIMPAHNAIVETVPEQQVTRAAEK